MNSRLRTADHVLIPHFQNQKLNPRKVQRFTCPKAHSGNSRACMKHPSEPDLLQDAFLLHCSPERDCGYL